jgi:steroid delta-isomerase
MSKEGKMDNDLDATLIRYNKFVEQLTDESVEEFREFASPNVRYRDPMMDAKGVDAALAYMHKWFKDLDGLRFEMKGYARNGQIVFQHWLMTFRIKKQPKRLWELDGVSKIVFDDAGKIEDQIDYWDASPLLESFPVLGKVVTLIKKLVAR